MDPNSVLPLDSLSIKNQDDSDSCFDMLKKLPPLDSLLYIEDPKPNAGFNSQFDPTSFEEFSENIEGNNTISSDTIVSSNERCQKRTLKKSNTVTKDKLEMAEIKKFFDRPIKNAAKELNVGLTVLKKRCRELGIHRWPHRKLKSLNSLIGNLKGVGMEEEVKNLEEHRILIKQEPDAELTDWNQEAEASFSISLFLI
ncbi:BnaA02g10530D [Brassica napus]|uniref:BnaA02g10530D protein n=1 Tax=Brassica napus TaxID=3708 RepID=A0A078GQZ7_BRANA|nr:BnaA02g10530D [Brassica napus]